MEGTLELVRSLMGIVRVPKHFDKVFKNECMFTFDSPFSEAGLCVSLSSWQAYAMDMLEIDLKRNGGKGGLYLHQKFRRVEKPVEASDEKDPVKLAIGVAGGFLEDKWQVIKEHSVLVIDAKGSRTTVPLPCLELPTLVTDACDAIIAHQGAASMDDTARWEGEQELKDSKYARDLVQLPATKKISPNPADWRCEVSGDTQNLWLNLSDGHIGSGRRFWDGSGGSNGALDHFEAEQAKGNFYPLVVKLGTITPQGADVYSYAPDENDLVKDPLLANHLAHWGIDVMRMEKTDKTMAEMDVQLNMSYDWSRICESGSTAQRVRGPGLVGLKNLGNSCYMNSTVQLLLGLPEVKDRYLDAAVRLRESATGDVAGDLLSQVAKLTFGIHSERYAPPWREGDDEDDPRFLVAPQMFRTLIGKGHSEFSTGRQQDAAEFLQYLLEQLMRSERKDLGSRLPDGRPTSNLFEFAVEERLQESSGAGRVKYSRLQQNMLGLPVKLEDADNLAEVLAFREQQSAAEKEAKKPKTESDAEEPKPIIQMKTCLARFGASEQGIEFRGSTATKTSRLATMPRYLLVQLQRYYLDEKWVPSKLDCRVPMPETLNLEHLRGKGLQPNEEEMPADAVAPPPPAPPALEADDLIMAQLLSMGLAEPAARRACVATKNSGAEAAAAWFFEHGEEPEDSGAPPQQASSAAPGDGPPADPEALAMLSSMGFSETHVKAALKICSNSMERAADWLFSHSDDLDGAVAAASGGPESGERGPGPGGTEAARDYDDGVGEYSLVGFISHVGRHTSHGHYVCHMRRGSDNDWVIFDDQKVAKSEAPPLDLGYIYLYRRQ
mmetsp:Transcript_22548/g.49850  ORF Transcript_22548/g.49850 Transcript_22548/m.49850 type:complete len:835 (-) Transcript_22548:225-2729(-)